MNAKSNQPDTLDEILTKAFNDFYDYITEKDIIKVAHEYSEKTVYNQAKLSLNRYIDEIIGIDELSASRPLGMPEQIYNRLKDRDELRAELRVKLLKGTGK